MIDKNAFNLIWVRSLGARPVLNGENINFPTTNFSIIVEEISVSIHIFGRVNLRTLFLEKLLLTQQRIKVELQLSIRGMIHMNRSVDDINIIFYLKNIGNNGVDIILTLVG